MKEKGSYDPYFKVVVSLIHFSKKGMKNLGKVGRNMIIFKIFKCVMKWTGIFEVLNSKTL